MTKKQIKALRVNLVKFQNFVQEENTHDCICSCGNEHESEEDNEQVEEVQNTINLLDDYLTK